MRIYLLPSNYLITTAHFNNFKSNKTIIYMNYIIFNNICINGYINDFGLHYSNFI
jgi:hypothetical protein